MKHATPHLFRHSFATHLLEDGYDTVTDRVEWPLVTEMRYANVNAARWRLEAARR